MNKINKWYRLNIAYLFIVTCIFLLIGLQGFFTEILLWKIIYFSSGLLFYSIVLALRSSLFDIIPEKTRLVWGQKKIIKWKSLEFDEFVGDDLYCLFKDSQHLLRQAKKSDQPYLIFDYAYVVLPAAKSYEGVLKKILVNSGLVSEQILLERPELSLNSYFNPVCNENIFSVLKDKARDKAIPYIIYSTYQECRNEILHYDSYRENRITLEDADFYIRRIDDAISKAYRTFIINK